MDHSGSADAQASAFVFDQLGALRPTLDLALIEDGSRIVCCPDGLSRMCLLPSEHKQ